MKDYYQKSIEALQLNGMSESTQKAYTRRASTGRFL